MIIVLHGMNGNGLESTTCKSIKEYFSGENVICPTYDSSKSHSEIANYLESFVENVLSSSNEELIFIGCSMGGYWARYLANKFTADKLIMLNPSLELYEEGIKKDSPSLPIAVFLGMKDEVVDPQIALEIYKNRAYIVSYPNGDHRLHKELVYILPDIEKLINTYIQ